MNRHPRSKDFFFLNNCLLIINVIRPPWPHSTSLWFLSFTHNIARPANLTSLFQFGGHAISKYFLLHDLSLLLQQSQPSQSHLATLLLFAAGIDLDKSFILVLGRKSSLYYIVLTWENVINLHCKWTRLENISTVSRKDYPISPRPCFLMDSVCFMGLLGKQPTQPGTGCRNGPHNQSTFVQSHNDGKSPHSFSLLSLYLWAEHLRRVSSCEALILMVPEWGSEPWYAKENQLALLPCFLGESGSLGILGENALSSNSLAGFRLVKVQLLHSVE